MKIYIGGGKLIPLSRKIKIFLKYVLPYHKKLLNYIGLKISLKLKKPSHRFYPPTIGFETTSRCNLQCPLCVRAREKLNRPEGTMSFDNLKKVIDTLGDYLIHARLHGWGEPFLNPDILEMAAYAHAKGIYTNFHTNGHFLTEKNINKIIDSGLDEINIALDGMSSQTYEKYRLGGNVQIVKEGVERLCRIKKKRKVKQPNVNLQFLVMAQNEHEIPEVKKFAEESGVDQLIIKTLNVVLVEDDTAKNFLPQNSKYSRYKTENNRLEFKKENPCTYIFMEIRVNWDGTISLCSCDDTHGDYISGNFFTDSIKDIIFGKEFVEARKKSLTKSFKMCKKCEGNISSL